MRTAERSPRDSLMAGPSVARSIAATAADRRHRGGCSEPHGSAHAAARPRGRTLAVDRRVDRGVRARNRAPRDRRDPAGRAARPGVHDGHADPRRRRRRSGGRCDARVSRPADVAAAGSRPAVRPVDRAVRSPAARTGQSRAVRYEAMTPRSLQETFSPAGRCFGCGPANDKGLRIRSFATPDAHVTCDFTPEVHHEAFDNVLCGGIIGTLLDCHMNWTAVHHFTTAHHLDHAPACVTAEFKVVLKRPTPRGPVHLDAHVVSSTEDRAVVEATMTAGGKVTALGFGTFVAVKPDHPAYHRW